MITIRKLKTLNSGTLRRKTAVILQSFEDDLLKSSGINFVYLSQLLELTAEAFPESAEIAGRVDIIIKQIAAITVEDSMDSLLRAINGLRNEILKILGAEPADWDFSTVHSPVFESESENYKDRADLGLGQTCIFLDDIRSPFNIGSIFRTAEAFGVSRVLLSPDCPSPEHPRAKRSSMGSTEMIDWAYISKDELFKQEHKTEALPVFALELGGANVADFEFPDYGIAVIGSEELGISPESRKAAAESLGLVSVPIYGRKGSINVSVAFGIMMHRWSEKQFLNR